MHGCRAVRSAPEGSPEFVDLSLTGLPPPLSQRPGSASAPKAFVRSVSVATGSESRRKVLEATGPGGSRAINNLRRSNSATQVNQPWTGSARPAEPPNFLMLFESSPGGRRRPTGLSKASGEKAATWNVLDEQPRASGLQASAQDAPVAPRRKECTLAPNFTANNRSNKGAMGNCVTSMVHNHYTPSEKAQPLKSSNQTTPSLNNIIKAATSESSEASSFKKNFSSGNHTAPSAAVGSSAPLRRKEVTEEEAER